MVRDPRLGVKLETDASSTDIDWPDRGGSVDRSMAAVKSGLPAVAAKESD